MTSLYSSIYLAVSNYVSFCRGKKIIIWIMKYKQINLERVLEILIQNYHGVWISDYISNMLFYNINISIEGSCMTLQNWYIVVVQCVWKYLMTHLKAFVIQYMQSIAQYLEVWQSTTLHVSYIYTQYCSYCTLKKCYWFNIDICP